MARENGSGARWERILIFAGAGALATLVAAWLRPRLEGTAPPPGRPVVWVGDRDGGQVLGLDADGLPSRSIRVAYPLELAARSDGGLWVLAGSASLADPVRRLLRFTDRGEVATEVPVPVASSLVALRGGDALLVAGAGAARALIRVAADGEEVLLVPVAPGAEVALAVGPAGILVSERRGVRLLGAGGTEGFPGRVFRPVAPRADGWWVVERRAEGTLLLGLDRSLTRELARPLDELGLDEAGELWLAPIPDGGLWIADARGRVVRLDSRGRVRARSAVSLPGLLGCAAAEGGGLWLIVPGALLRLNSRGGAEPGQGGFDYLAALAVPGA